MSAPARPHSGGRYGRARGAQLLLPFAVSLLTIGCAPTLNILGVYFPGWLASTLTGVGTAYCVVWWLGREQATRELAQSGLFFVSLTCGVAFVAWLILFSSY